jgi:4-hydroxy-tetrahydrodipicolinate reductase
MAISIALVGASGRMGTRIAALAAEDAGIVISARLGRAMRDQPAAGVDVVIDFSSEEGTRSALAFARERRAALLVGTTGLGAETKAQLAAASREIAVLVAPNTSLGVAVTRKLSRIAAELLGGAGWSVDLVESHHDRKKDAPSGTALAIAESLAQGGMPVAPDRIHAIRAGDTIGEHEIRFAGPSERIHLMHQAVSRDLFAAGALRAARWLAGRAPGGYCMDDVLGSA